MNYAYKIWLPQTPKSYDRKHLETMAANIRAHLILLDAGGKEIQRQQITSPQVTDSPDNPKLAGTNVELHTEAYQKYTVILTIDSVGVPVPEMNADLAVRLTPNASEGNEIWSWLIKAWGVTIVLAGGLWLFLVIRADRKQKNLI